MLAPTRVSRALIAALFSLCAASAVLADDLTQTITLDSQDVELVNLIGTITVGPASGSTFEATITIHGADAKPGLIDVVTEDGDHGRILIKFPVDEYRDYVYPALGRNSHTSVTPDDGEHRGLIGKIIHGFGAERINVRGHGKGLEVWTDVELRVPADHDAKVAVSVGGIDAADVVGALVLDTGSGAISAHHHTGDLLCDTGSGAVEVADVQGELSVDTGSGGVQVRNHTGASLKVDTGSGSVRVENVDTGKLDIDTGSGSVKAYAVKTDGARIDTGSGSVTFTLARMGAGRFLVDTGSGSVDVQLPRDASADITIDVGSGSIRCDVPEAEVLHKEDDELHVRVGTGDAHFVIDTGSGGAHVTQEPS